MARHYATGSRWAFWRWTDVDYDGESYLLRLHVLKTPWFNIMVHWIRHEDPHEDPHDHPVNFLSVTLRGGYIEWTPAGTRSSRVRYYRATDIHKIVAASSNTTTLCITGPNVREWGFHTAIGFVPWKEYRDALRAEKGRRQHD